MIELLIDRAGGAVSLQDRGRVGWGHIGLPRSGALDQLALSVANVLVGNRPDTVAIEFCLSAASLQVSGGSVRMALAGAAFELKIDEQSIACHTSFLLMPGQRLTIRPGKHGVCAMLAVEGGFDVPTVLGSKSLYRRGEIGGLNGQSLRNGDRLPIRSRASARPERQTRPIDLKLSSKLRVVLGPQDSYFSEGSIQSFLSQTFVVTQESDRMGYRLDGKPIRSTRAQNMISDGVVEGSVQITGAGGPIVLLADHQTTGGYPKIATVITPDLRLVAQRRPGDAISFKSVSLTEAHAAVRRQSNVDREILAGIRKIDPLHLTNSLHDIADNAVNAVDPRSWDCLQPHL